MHQFQPERLPRSGRVDRYDRRIQFAAVFPVGVVAAVADQLDDVDCNVVAGNMAVNVLGIPSRPSITTIRMS